MADQHPSFAGRLVTPMRHMGQAQSLVGVRLDVVHQGVKHPVPIKKFDLELLGALFFLLVFVSFLLVGGHRGGLHSLVWQDYAPIFAWEPRDERWGNWGLLFTWYHPRILKNLSTPPIESKCIVCNN